MHRRLENHLVFQLENHLVFWLENHFLFWLENHLMHRWLENHLVFWLLLLPPPHQHARFSVLWLTGSKGSLSVLLAFILEAGNKCKVAHVVRTVIVHTVFMQAVGAH